MRRTSLVFTAAVLLALAAWNPARSSASGHTRLTAVAGADYVISMAVARQAHRQGAGTVITVSYALAKGDGVVAYEGKVQSVAANHDDDEVRRLMRSASDEIAGIVLAGKVPPKSGSSQTTGARP